MIDAWYLMRNELRPTGYSPGEKKIVASSKIMLVEVLCVGWKSKNDHSGYCTVSLSFESTQDFRKSMTIKHTCEIGLI
jgi:hypothetical protein